MKEKSNLKAPYIKDGDISCFILRSYSGNSGKCGNRCQPPEGAKMPIFGFLIPVQKMGQPPVWAGDTNEDLILDWRFNAQNISKINREDL